MSNHKFQVSAPLLDFQCDCEDFEFAPNVWVRRLKKAPDLKEMNSWLSNAEWERVSGASHWFIHESMAGEEPYPGEIENLLLLALWLVKPSRSQIAFRFEVGQGEADGNNKMSRLLDRFMWISGSIALDFETSDLQSASKFYKTLIALCAARLRLNDALLVTLGGCWAHAWQVSLVCHAAAVEAILSYSTGRGVTGRLATSFACLTESQPSARDAAFREFVSLYSSRSDIMHGRTHNIAIADRLSILARFQNALRKLWTVVCSSPALTAVLEGTDTQREAYFKTIQQGYTPPP